MVKGPGLKTKIKKTIIPTILSLLVAANLGIQVSATSFDLGTYNLKVNNGPSGQELIETEGAAQLQSDGSYVVNNWEDLKSLGTEENGVWVISNDYTIKLGSDLVACTPIKITGNVNIISDSNNTVRTIYRYGDEKPNSQSANFTVFTVDNGGTLNLGNNIVMSGKVAKPYDKMYTLKVTDGLGNTIYTKTVNPGETKTIDELMTSARIVKGKDGVVYSEDEETALGSNKKNAGTYNLVLIDGTNTAANKYQNGFDLALSDKANSPWVKEYTNSYSTTNNKVKYEFIGWDKGGVDTSKTLAEIDGDVTIVAKWRGHYNFKVTDGYGAVIYEELIPTDETRSVQDIMTAAGLLAATTRDALLESTLKNVTDHPYALGYQFDSAKNETPTTPSATTPRIVNGWSYGEIVPTRPIKDLSPSASSIVVTANWIVPYTLTVTDGQGNIIHKNTNVDKTKTVAELMAAATEGDLTTEAGRNTAFSRTLADKTNSPYYEGYEFVEWVYGKKSDGTDVTTTTTMEDIGGNLTVGAKWTGKVTFKVTDGYGNEIYKKEDISVTDTTTIQTLMQDATVGNLLNQTTRDAALAAALTGKTNSPYAKNFTINNSNPWNYGKDKDGNAITLSSTVASIGGNITVVANWNISLIVSDGYGNVIYKKKISSSEMNSSTTPYTLMQNAYIYKNLTTGEIIYEDEATGTQGVDWDRMRVDLTKVTYKQSGNINGGEFDIDPFIFSLKNKPTSPYNLAYEFNGWDDGYNGGLLHKAYYNSESDKIDKDVLIVAKWNTLTQDPLNTWADVQAAIRRDGYVLLGTATEKAEDRKYLGVSGNSYEMTGFNGIWYDANNERPYDRFKVTLAPHVSGDDGNNVRYRLLVNGYKLVFTTSGVYSTGDTWPTTSNVQYKFFLDETGQLRTFEKPNSGWAAYKADGTVRYHWDVAFDPASGDLPIKFYTVSQAKGSTTVLVDETKKETPGYQSTSIGFLEGNKDTPGYSAPDGKNPTPTGYSAAATIPQTVLDNKDNSGKQSPLRSIEDAITITDTAGKSTDTTLKPCEKPIDPNSIKDTRYTAGTAIQQFNKNGQGFFVQVNSNSTLNINGAVLKDLNTGRLDNNGVMVRETSVTNSAPVVVNGGTLNFTSGSIQNNSVGYAADDKKSGLQAQGRNTEHNSGDESYLKSTPMTNTAGGIIFKNGAKGEISGSASIDHNKGDVGGILLQGANTEVTIGAKNPDLNTAERLTILDGGHVDSNVGFHHAGAAQVEDGAILRMAGQNSTMNNNVTWAKGGAVWATEFGTAGYAQIDYRNKKLVNSDIKDSREEGVFIMVNGTIDNNTAFLRGGAINVESNHVHLLGGTISSNYSRVLGGGIYVEGDFPSYTYTLLLDKGYVGHNYAVRYWNLDNSEAADTPVNGKYDGKTVSQLNDILDRKLGTFTGDYPLAYTDNGVTPDISGTPGTQIAKGTGYPNRTADTLAYPRPHEGAGGGIWLCPIGGTAIFHLHNDHEVIVDDNYASGNGPSDTKKGTDLYLHSGTGHLLVSNSDFDGETWENETTGEEIKDDGETYSGPLYLINQTDNNRPAYTAVKIAYSSNTYNANEAAYYATNGENQYGVRIIDNISRDGGGIAANGTLLFGSPKDVFRHEAKLGFKKIWPANSLTYPVEFKMFYIQNIVVTEANATGTPKTLTVKSSQLDSDGDGKIDPTYTVDGVTYNVPSVYVGKDALPALEGYEFKLNGKAGDSDDYEMSPENTVPSPTATEPGGKQANGEYHWTADTTIPISVETIDANGDTISLPLYKLEYVGNLTSVDIELGGDINPSVVTVPIPVDANGKKIIDPSTEDGMKIIYAIAKNEGEEGNFRIAEWNIVMKEYNSAGLEIEEAEFSGIENRQVKLTKDDDVTVIDAGGLGKKIKGYSISFTEATFESTARNAEGPTVEKYINNKVHQDLAVFDQVFEYSIMAYVPLDAEEIMIEDTLEAPLMFVDNKLNVPGNPYVAAHVKYPNGQFLLDGQQYNVVTNGLEYWLVAGENEYYKIYNPERDSNNVLTSFASISETAETKRANTSNWAVYKKGVSKYKGNAIVDNSTLNGYGLIIEPTNDHKGNGTNGTVVGHTNNDWFSNHPEQVLNGPIQNNTIEIGYYNGETFVQDVTGNTIRVTITNDMLKGEATGSTANQLDAHGKWVVLSYKAAIKPEYRDPEILRATGNGWITNEESKKGSPNFISDLEEKAGVTVTTLYKNESKGLYYARGVDASGNTHNYIYVAVSPEKIRNMDDHTQAGTNNRGVLKDEYLAQEWYEMYVRPGKNYTSYKSVSYPQYDDVNLFHASHNHSYELEEDGSGRIELAEDTNRGIIERILSGTTSTINGHTARKQDIYNYPVIDAIEPHAGVKNQASYTVTYPTGGKSKYKTNIVTIDVVQPEKYVNNKIHEVLRDHSLTTEDNNPFESFDKVFEYEIMAYVPESAEEIVIWDTLKGDLMFVDKYNQPQYKTFTIGTEGNPTNTDIANNLFMTQGSNDTNDGMTMVDNSNVTGYQLQYYDNNTHKGDGTGTVKDKGTDLNGPINTDGYIKIANAPAANIDWSTGWSNIPTKKADGNTIFVKIDSTTGIENVRGKWVKLAFKVKIKPSSYAKIVNKISKDNRYTTDKTLAEGYSTENPNPTPAGYFYREAQYTTVKMNADNYVVATDTATPAGYYTKDGTGAFTVSNTGTPASGLVEGTDYIYFYEAAYNAFVYNINDVPTGAQTQPAYIKDGWNNKENTWNWDKVTDDGYVLDGINLYSQDNPYLYADVQEDGSHAGIANDANYAVKLDNEWSQASTNTVTVVPLLRTITINKTWIVDTETTMPTAQDLLDHLHLYWEKVDSGGAHGKLMGDITDLYKSKFNVYQKSEIVTGEKVRYSWVVEVKDLPRLDPGFKYYISEVRFSQEGFERPTYINPEDPEARDHAHDKGTITNSIDDGPDSTQLLVTKTWDTGLKGEEEGQSIEVQLLANGQPIMIDDGNGNQIVDPESIKRLPYDGNWYYEWRPLPRYEKDSSGAVIEEPVMNPDREYYYDVVAEVDPGTGYVHCTPKSDLSGCLIEKLTDKYEYEVERDLTGNIEYYFEKGFGDYPLDPEGNKIPKFKRDSNGNRIVKTKKKEIVYSVKLNSDPEGYILSSVEKTNKNIAEVETQYMYEAYDYDPELGQNQHLLVIGGFNRHRDNLTGTIVDTPFTSEKIEELNSKSYPDEGFIKSDYFMTCIESVLLPSTADGSYPEGNVCLYRKYEEYDTYETELINTKPQIEKYINKDVHLETYFANSFVYDVVVYVPYEATEIEITDELLPTLKLDSFLEAQVYGDDYKKYVESYNTRSLESMSNPITLIAFASNNHTINGSVGPKVIAPTNQPEVNETAKAYVTVDGKSFKVKIDNIVSVGSTYIEYPDGEYIYVDKVGKDTDLKYVKADQIENGYTAVNDKFYRLVDNPYYVEAEGDTGEYYRVWNSAHTRRKYILKSDLSTAIAEHYEREDTTKTYNKVNDPSQDQKIGGYYVQLSFKARFDLNDETEAALKEWVENPNSKRQGREDLAWDVIKETGNVAWDNYVRESLIASGHTGSEEYITDTNTTNNLNYSDFTPLLDYLNNNGSKPAKVLAETNYYYVKDTDGNYYQFRRTHPGDEVGYRNLVGQWFRVVKPTGNANTNADIYELDGNRGKNVSGGDAWLGESYNTVTGKLDGSTPSVTLVPVEPNLYVKINDMYYLKDVADMYAPADDYTDKTTYCKVDWGRGDGDVIRNNTSEYTGDHAGVVNTASYEVTYGNGYKSNHKSNTVTVVPHIYELPSSGGIGTYIHTILGTMFVALGFFYFLQRRKMNNVNS